MTAPSVSVAQELFRRPWSLRDLFFLPRRADRLEPRRAVPGHPTKARKRPRSKSSGSSIARAPREPEVPVVEKQADARVVLVVGDFLGAGLAEGLTIAFEQNPRIKVIDRTSGSSGFVRDDYYNWPQKIPEMIDAEKPAAVLVMLGANDRQQMRVGDVREPPRSENWTKEYTLRTEALAKAISDKKTPFLWVGVPAFKSSKMLSDMLAFNDIYRTAAEGVSAEFVDIWDGFVDENGAYVSTGPDMNGQPVRLRSDDGINLTRSGKRKLAFFAEKPLLKLLGETGAAGVAALTPASLPAAVPATVDIGSIKRTAPVSLRDPELDGGSELLGLVVTPKRDARSPGEKLAIEGIAPDALPGRADDFSAPRPVAPTAAQAPAAPETTTAIIP